MPIYIIMFNITYKDRNTNIWVREMTKVIDIISNVRNMKWSYRQGISTASKMTDGPRVSPFGDHVTRKDDKTSQAVERRPGQILERHDLAEDSTTQPNLETAC